MKKGLNYFKNTFIVYGINMKCEYCKRELPKKNFKTKQGCIWCDALWHLKKLRKQKLVSKY